MVARAALDWDRVLIEATSSSGNLISESDAWSEASCTSRSDHSSYYEDYFPCELCGANLKKEPFVRHEEYLLCITCNGRTVNDNTTPEEATEDLTRGAVVPQYDTADNTDPGGSPRNSRRMS